MKKIKKMALETILLSMEEVKDNLGSSALTDDVKVNSESMKTLAEAFKTVSSIKCR